MSQRDEANLYFQKHANFKIYEEAKLSSLQVLGHSDLKGKLTIEANPQVTGNVSLTGTITGTQPPTFAGLEYPATDGSPGQVLSTDGHKHLTFTSPAGGGNVSGSGPSILHSIPAINNLTTTAIVGTPGTIDPISGNIVTPGSITSAGNLVATISNFGINDAIAIFDGINNILTPTTVTISNSGNIVTPGNVVTGTGTLVSGTGVSTPHQVPILGNNATSAILPTPVTIDPSTGNIVTPGNISTPAGLVVSGNGSSNVNSMPVINNLTTSAIISSVATLNSTSGNIVTPGSIKTGAITYPIADGSSGQILTTNGLGQPAFINSPGNILGSGSSSVNQVPVINNTSTTALIPSVVTINPTSGNINTPGQISSGSGIFVLGTGSSTINQVPVLNNSTTSAIVASPVTINPLNGNISTPGTFTSASGNLVTGSGSSAIDSVPVISNNSTSAIIPSVVTINPITGNISTPGSISSGGGVAGNVSGSGTSIVNQIPIINNTSTTAIIPSIVTINPSNGNVATIGTVTASGFNYAPGVISGKTTLLPNQPYRCQGSFLLAGGLRVMSAGNNNLVTPFDTSNTFSSYFTDNQFTGLVTGSVIQIQIGYANVAIVTSTGQLWIRGDNSVGQLGNGTTVNTSNTYKTFNQVTGIPAVQSVHFPSSNESTNLTVFVVTTLGELLAWGYNSNGALGNNTTSNSPFPLIVSLPNPVSVANNIGNVAVGSCTNCWISVVLTTGALYSWGYNAHGQLGINSLVDAHVPTLVAGITCKTAVLSVIADSSNSEFTTRILQTSGITAACGTNTFGQLGNGNTSQSSVFVNDISGDINITQLFYSTAMTHCWLNSSNQLCIVGCNTSGQLGNGNFSNSSTRVKPVFTGQGTVIKAQSYSAGTFGCTYLVTNTGTVWSTGSVQTASLGNGTSSTDTNFNIFQLINMPGSSHIIDMIAYCSDDTSSQSVKYLSQTGAVFSVGYNGDGNAGILQSTNNYNISIPTLVPILG
jgi:alpha-tubulin suppressor-like RCC1 family protein